MSAYVLEAVQPTSISREYLKQWLGHLERARAQLLCLKSVQWNSRASHLFMNRVDEALSDLQLLQVEIEHLSSSVERANLALTEIRSQKMPGVAPGYQDVGGRGVRMSVWERVEMGSFPREGVGDAAFYWEEFPEVSRKIADAGESVRLVFQAGTEARISVAETMFQGSEAASSFYEFSRGLERIMPQTQALASDLEALSKRVTLAHNTYRQMQKSVSRSLKGSMLFLAWKGEKSGSGGEKLAQEDNFPPEA